MATIWRRGLFKKNLVNDKIWSTVKQDHVGM